MIRRLPSVCLALSLLVALPGCLTPRWAQPVNPFMNDDNDRGKAALAAKDYVMALEFYGRLAAKDPENMQARYQLALINQELGRYDEAYGHYRVVYVSASEEGAPRADGSISDEPLYAAADRNLNLLGARLAKNDPDLRVIKEDRARKIEEAKAKLKAEAEADKAEEAAKDEARKAMRGELKKGPCNPTNLKGC
ncbi:tetratricopeptide repeat protein [Niveispirillum sp. KHB5.9]|uniref:tetratricopeptide repeat protein n=1 Tax=Niveispirillum sp. KHB5.9 TaxID=3400269 RepID=UPI003A835C49